MDKRKYTMYSITLDDIPVLIMVVNRHHMILYTNKKSYDVFGYKPEELVGQNISILVPDEFAPKHVQQVEDFFSHPVTRPLGIGRDIYGLCKDKTVKRVEISLVSILIDKESCVLVTIVDVDVRKFLESVTLITKTIVDKKEETLDTLEIVTPPELS